MFGGGGIGSIHDDVLNANPVEEDAKRRLVDEIKTRAKGSISTKNYPEAVKLYTKGIELNVENAVLYANRSMCKYNLGSYNEAMSDAELAITSDPKYAKAYYRKAVSLIALKDYPKAEEALRGGLALVPTDKDFLAQMEKVKKLSSANPSSSSTSVTTSSPVSSQKTSKASSSVSRPSSENVERDVDDDLTDSAKLRGYKKTADGKVTTYFNTELDETAKKLIGDIAPKKITPDTPPPPLPAASKGSAWNAAGTCETKDVTPWATDRLKHLLEGVVSNTGEVSVWVSAVHSLEGDAQVMLNRGKKKHIMDYRAELDWKLTKSGTEMCSGKIVVEDMTCDEDSCEFSVQVKTGEAKGSELAKTYVKAPKGGLQGSLRKTLSTFCSELKAK